MSNRASYQHIDSNILGHKRSHKKTLKQSKNRGTSFNVAFSGASGKVLYFMQRNTQSYSLALEESAKARDVYRLPNVRIVVMNH